MQPVFIEDSITIAANSVNNNVIASNNSLTRYRRAPFRAKGKLVAIQSAVSLTFDLDHGSVNVVAASSARVSSTTMEEPLDTVNGEWYVEEGDELVLRATNPTGSGIALRYRIELIPWAGELPPDSRVMQQGPIAVANNTIDQQLLTGLRYVRPPVDCIGTVLMSQSALGLTRQVYVDTQNVAPPSALPVSNRIPLDPFDMSVNGMECPQDKLIELSVSNASGGSLNVFWKLILQELVRR